MCKEQLGGLKYDPQNRILVVNPDSHSSIPVFIYENTSGKRLMRLLQSGETLLNYSLFSHAP